MASDDSDESSDYEQRFDASLGLWTDQRDEWLIRTEVVLEPWGKVIPTDDGGVILVDGAEGDGSLKIAGVESSATSGDGSRLAARWELLEGSGRPEPVRLTITPRPGQPLTGDEVRRQPIGTVLTLMRGCISEHMPEFRREWGIEGHDDYELKDGPHRGRRLAAGELQRVADVYNRARFHGLNVREAVQNAFGLTASGAAKRIAAARRAGLIDETRKQR